jgi:phosphoglycolate phosphatase
VRYRLYIFDFDGTLADSFAWFANMANDVADKYGFRRIAPDEYDTFRGLSAGELVKRLGVPVWKMPMIAAHVRKRMTADIDQIRPFPGVHALFERLTDNGAAIGIVSSNAQENVRTVLGRESADRVTYYECGAALLGKDTRLRQVLRRSGIPATQAIFIGDEIRDAEAARRVDIDFGGVAWGYTRADALLAQAPAVMFSGLDEIATMSMPA